MVVVTCCPEVLIGRQQPYNPDSGWGNDLQAGDCKSCTMRLEEPPPLRIDSPTIAMEMLPAALQLENLQLLEECVRRLDEHLAKDNVLDIYSQLSKCSKGDQPSAPPVMDAVHNCQRSIQLIGYLRQNCLLIIDKEADFVLNQKEIIDLAYRDIYEILSRDTLEVSNEMLVYCTVYLWGIAECSRTRNSVTSLQQLLRSLKYVPRYGLMTKKQFLSSTVGGVKGPTKSGVLNEGDWRLIKFYIDQKSKGKVVKELDYKMSVPRCSGSDNPQVLSSKSSCRYERVRKVSSDSSKNKFERCMLNLLTCWIAVFD